MSTALLCPCYLNISGATYSGVPTNVFVFSYGFNSFDIPKSARDALPFSSNKIFSGFKSLYIIF